MIYFQRCCNQFSWKSQSTKLQGSSEENALCLAELGTNMSIRVHFFFSCLYRFSDNLKDYSEEQGERFYQNIKVMKEIYQGRRDERMMTDCCWNLMKDCLKVSHKRTSYKRQFLITSYLV